MKAKDILESPNKADLTPMIDVVFLLLIFFMVTTTLIKQEADLSFQLPSNVAGEPTDELPTRVMIDILPDGSILLNGGMTGDPPASRSLPALTSALSRLRGSAARMDQKTVVTIQPDPVSPHAKAVQVLNACAEADIKFVSFATVSEG